MRPLSRRDQIQGTGAGHQSHLDGVGAYNRGIGSILRHSHSFAHIALSTLDGITYERVNRPFAGVGARLAAGMRLTEDPLTKLDNRCFRNRRRPCRQHRAPRTDPDADRRESRSGAAGLPQERLNAAPVIRPALPEEYDEIARVWMESWVSTGLEDASNFLLANLRARVRQEIEQRLEPVRRRRRRNVCGHAGAAFA